MARGRMLNRSISRDRLVADLVAEVGGLGGLFYTWMIAHLDREGRIDGDPSVLKGAVVPRVDECTVAVIEATLAAADRLGLIVWYEANGDHYVAYPKFSKNQKGLRVSREPESEFPAPTRRQTAAKLPPNCGEMALQGKGREGKYNTTVREHDPCSPQTRIQDPPAEVPNHRTPDHTPPPEQPPLPSGVVSSFGSDQKTEPTDPASHVASSIEGIRSEPDERTTLGDFTQILADSGLAIQISPVDRERFSRIKPDKFELRYAVGAAAKRHKTDRLTHPVGWVLKTIERQREDATRERGKKPPPAARKPGPLSVEASEETEASDLGMTLEQWRAKKASVAAYAAAQKGAADAPAAG